MKTDMNWITLRQVEKILAPWRVPLPRKPSKGWIKVLRDGLGMPASYLARVMGVEQSTIKRYEEAEASGSISMKTLEKVADALGCELKYALVPKDPLDKMIEQRAIQITEERMNAVARTMALEDQSTLEDDRTTLVAEQVNVLINGSRFALWR